MIAAQGRSVDSLSTEEAFAVVRSGPRGLTPEEAAQRRERAPKVQSTGLLADARVFLRQFRSPILLLLAFAAALSGLLGEVADCATILTTLLASAILTFYQERQADSAVRRLMSVVETKCQVLREGRPAEVPLGEVVPGDVVLLKAGSSVPGDGRILESEGLLVDEAALTGESVPVEKGPRPGKQGALYAGTHVQSGSGTMLVLHVGDDTAFGAIAHELRQVRPEPQFHQGVRRYGYLLMEFTLLLTMGVFLVNVFLKKPALESFMFSLALTVGLTPQLLPAIMSVTLARGANQLAGERVIVKRLQAIEDFGSMDVLCSDKTGTLTEGSMRLYGGFDPDGRPSDAVVRWARINAFGSRAFENPIDAALREGAPADFEASLHVAGQVPYDFVRRRESVIVDEMGERQLIAKGSVASILAVCSDFPRAAVQSRYEELSEKGLRVLGVATRRLATNDSPDPELEREMEFVGLIAFEDPLREDVVDAVAALREMGVQLKILTGDNRHVAAYVAAKVGLAADRVMTGDELAGIPEPALVRRIQEFDAFAEVDPVQKERLLRAFRKAGHVVGYIGDGINDAPALHAADVGISVAGAVDVAREAADFVMLERGLGVISRGIVEGRRIFANTMKYVFVTSSANFGNMFSMAAGSMFLPFLPLLPKQILLNNFITDIPAMSIAGDAVDDDLVRAPRRWDVRSLRNFMVLFGIHSSLFDLLTFGALIGLLRADETGFHTAWFVESAVSEFLILLVIRTRGRLLTSRPGRILAIASASCAAVTFLLPVSPLGPALGFRPLPAIGLALLIAILGAYLVTAEMLKRWFYRRYEPTSEASAVKGR
jgi:Mg2+-importing ATPase